MARSLRSADPSLSVVDDGDPAGRLRDDADQPATGCADVRGIKWTDPGDSAGDSAGRRSADPAGNAGRGQ